MGTFWLETERLKMRFFNVEDAQYFYDLNLDPDVMKYTGDVPFESVEASGFFLADYIKNQKPGFGRMTVLLKDNLECIGWCGLRPLEDGTIDLGFRYFKKHWGRGYATEAGRASLQYGFEIMNLDRIIGRTARLNVGSVKVLEKLGMSFWKNDTCEGIEDSVYYSITKEDWFASHLK
jgi:ribosomal-protein-alanine N-acetyltransferase